MVALSMPRKVCLSQIATSFLPSVQELMGYDVALTASVELFDRPILHIRLEGDGLPEWCSEQPGGTPFAWGTLSIDCAGRLMLEQSGPPASANHRIQASIHSLN